ncbi:DUF58 domain-containing protein [Acidiferrimicrobium sp. IK]|uniref:DUF58 domain-containing protein n=1 Tax=Acidiferrimicrobium sp. IK TaxID=2871700 RepID=UPI0021CB7421|nr:DUF58 domain-containing protein [Acidiferrimicrobium sp. IK]MCU4185283.1 DUF58 domain-containing protein [Acidiferrimicrobium sp. IK]
MVAAPAPAAGRRLGRLPLTAAGWAVLGGGVACYLVAVVSGFTQLAVVAAGCLVALVAAGGFVSWRPNVALRRTFQPSAVTVGQPAVALLSVANRSRWPSPAITVVDRLARADMRLAVHSVAAGATALVRYQLPTDRRARLVLGPLRVVRSDPLGLLRARQDHGGHDLLWVRPRTWPLSPLPASVVVDLEGPVSQTAPTGSVTFASLREYVPGDDRRLIHWRSSARLGTLVVRHHVDTNEPRATVVLDNRSGRWTDDTFEAGVEVAASVAHALTGNGHRVELRTVREEPGWALRVGATTVADRLAAVEPVAAEDVSALLEAVGAGADGGALVVVTGRAEPRVDARLAAEQHRYSPVVICRVDPGAQAAWRQRSGVLVVHGPDASALADAWNRMAHR